MERDGRWLRVGRMTSSFFRAGLRGIGAISRLWWVDLQWHLYWRTQRETETERQLDMRLLCSTNACSSVAGFWTLVPNLRCLTHTLYVYLVLGRFKVPWP